MELINNTKLKSPCKTSRDVWLAWRNAGRPQSGTLQDKKKEAKKKIRRHVTSCHAKKESIAIENRDTRKLSRKFLMLKPVYNMQKATKINYPVSSTLLDSTLKASVSSPDK